MSTIGEDIIPLINKINPLTSIDSQALTVLYSIYCLRTKKTGPRETGGLSCLGMQ
jgi:hypothetical protein